MAETDGYCMVLTTCPTREEAHSLASLLIRGHGAACVQVTGITSYYEWKGEMNTDAEQLLIIKGRADAYEKIEGIISDNHSYEVPEIVRIPIDKGSAAYLGWIDKVSG